MNFDGWLSLAVRLTVALAIGLVLGLIVGAPWAAIAVVLAFYLAMQLLHLLHLLFEAVEALLGSRRLALRHGGRRRKCDGRAGRKNHDQTRFHEFYPTLACDVLVAARG